MAITVAWLNSVLNKPRDKILRKADTNGLSVRVTLRGKVVFTYRYRLEGKQTSVDLGFYPSTSLNEARSKALEIMTQLQEGNSPRDVIEEGAVPQILTIREICTRWYSDYVQVQRKNGDAKVIRFFESHLFPTLGDIPVNTLTVRSAFDLLSGLSKTKTSNRFRTVLVHLKQAFRYAVKFYGVENNPLSEITVRDFGKKPTIRDRILTEEELVQIINLVESGAVSEKQRCAFWLILHTGCRHSEVSQALKSDFDLDTNLWTVPRELSKNKLTISRPLISYCLNYLDQLMAMSPKSPYLIPSRDPDIKVCVPWAAKISTTINSKLKPEESLAAWTMHDLRRTARTAWSKLAQSHVAEIMLGHKLSGVHAVYDRYKYVDEMREAYQKWGDYIEGLKNKGA